jgi:LacI family transcriptional regulator
MTTTPVHRKKPPKAAATASATGSSVVTLGQVAQEAGVSPATVSRIINGTATVSPAKQAAVDAAIKKFGFRPNPVARGLAGGRTLSVGVLTQTISSPFYGEALRGIEDVLERAGYIPVFVSGHWHEKEERKALDALLSRRVDGVIVLAGRLSNAALKTYAKTLPLVVVGRELKGPNIFSLSFDNQAGADLATSHLLAQGHRRIAFIGGDPLHQDAQDRQAGYTAALARANLQPDPALMLTGDYTELGGLDAVNRLLDSGHEFSALFAANDQTAIGAALGLYRRGLRVPDDISLVGFDDLAPAKFAIPPLTTVRQSVYEMGSQAASAMLDLLAGQPPSVALPSPELVPRESTRALPA